MKLSDITSLAVSCILGFGFIIGSMYLAERSGSIELFLPIFAFPMGTLSLVAAIAGAIRGNSSSKRSLILAVIGSGLIATICWYLVILDANIAANWDQPSASTIESVFRARMYVIGAGLAILATFVFVIYILFYRYEDGESMEKTSEQSQSDADFTLKNDQQEMNLD